MREVGARVTSKGQVTIPIEIRRMLGIHTPGNVAFLIEEGQVRLAGRRSAVQRTAGALEGTELTMTIEKEREAAERAIAVEAEERSR
jgi:AbrB family looped-hinge helix DNA binding protein